MLVNYLSTTRSLMVTTLSFALLIFGNLSFAQTVVTETLTSGNSWVVPCGVTDITVEVIGGGGGGGRGGGGCAAGGGGSGAYTTVTVSVVAGQTFFYSIGSGGPGATAAPGVGGAGGQTTFTDGATLILTADGGLGGAVGGNGGGCSGGAPGNGGPNANGGSSNSNGNNGIAGETNGAGIGGKGGSSPNFPGVGGVGSPSGIDGSPGYSPGGGGGGGGVKNGSYTPNGGNGGSGAIILTYVSSVNQADAGPDQQSCVAMTMDASVPSPGWTGQWALVSGSANIVAPNDPTSNIGMVPNGTCPVLTWTLSSAGCPDFVDTIIVCNPVKCNDAPCGAISIPVTSGSCSWSTFSNFGATSSGVMPEPGCGNYTGNDLWFSAVVPANGILTVQAQDQAGVGGVLLPGIALYTGSDCGNLEHAGCNYSAISTTPAEITYLGTPGETVYIRYWNIHDYVGNFQICASTTSSFTGGIDPGMNTLTCGTAANFFDPGGNPGNYPNNSGGTYTICPDTPGQYIQIDFTSGFFNVEPGYDKMTILDGGVGTDALIGQWDGTNSPGIITSSAADGCLTVLWQCDQIGTRAGWWAKVRCSPNPGTHDTICSATNCTGGCGQWVCGDGLYDTTNDGNGVEDLAVNTSGCFTSSGEIASKWFYFTALNSGTVEFSFDGPNGQDYNFAVWGPSTNGVPPCPMGNENSPLRCSQGDIQGHTNPVGLSAVLGAGDYYEGVEGDGWVDALRVQAGETYAMILNIYQNGNPQPVIDMTIGGSADLDCAPVYLSASIIDFQGVNMGDENYLSWVSRSQYNNAKFLIERSSDGDNWEIVGEVEGAGTSQASKYYTLTDNFPHLPVTFYRIAQVDYDGKTRYHQEVISVTSEKPIGDDFVSAIYPNPTEGNASFVYNGTKLANITVQVRNELGQLVTVQEFNNVYPEIPQTLNCDRLSIGMYQVTFIEGDHVYTQKLSVIR